MAKLLIVEDEGVVAWHIQEAVENMGHTVVASVASGKKAVEIVAETQPDLVLMDILLKGELDGIEAAQQIYDRFNTPVIYLTAYADDQTLERALTTNPFGYLIKPFQEKELRTTLEIALYRHRLETSLEEKKDWFFTTLNSLGEATIATDAKGYINFINPAATALTGWSANDILGKNATTFLNFINAETHEKLDNPLIQAIREDLIISLPAHCLLQTKNGQERPIGDTVAPIKNSNGEIIGSVLVFQDISERQQELLGIKRENLTLELTQKNLVAQLQERTLQLQQALDCSQIIKRVIAKVDIYSNETEIFQTTLQELGHILSADYCWISQHDEHQNIAIINCEYISDNFNIPTQLHTQINISSFPVFYRRLFERETWLSPPKELLPTPYQLLLTPQQQILICPIYDEQRVIGEIGILTTEKPLLSQSQTELVSQVISQCAITLRQVHLYEFTQECIAELELLNNLKDDFISAVSHELRAPLTNMKMAVEMLQHIVHSLHSADLQSDVLTNRLLLWQKLEQYLQILQEEWQKEYHLISDLLNFQSSKTITEPFTFINLHQWLPEVIDCFTLQAQKQRQTLNFQILSVTSEIISHLPSLERIIKELLTNACKYSPPDSTITLTAKVLATKLEINVINTGIEIPPQELDKIFEPFYRCPRANSCNYSGTGLGLALVKKLLQRLGGEISVQSQNKETRFVITLPL